ncbi:MAG: 2-oxoacid:acceptor oxidoreductase subunit alpha [Thermodesulfovibrionales bacterium]|nr:2-oxoacid:acceptor oxidoreductase subunit alpha [Thermodesulfovibrionales bacterium]
MDYTIKIGGEAGQGVQTIGETLSRVFSKSGYHVFSYQDYESRIRGGHNFYQIRIADKPLTTFSSKVNILVAMDKESIISHENELSENSQVVYDSSVLNQKFSKSNFLDIPFLDISIKVSGSKIMANSVIMGAVLGMLGMKLDLLKALLKEAFKGKDDKVIKDNEEAAHRGYDYATKHCITCSFFVPVPNKNLMLISGNEAIGLGAISAGLRFYSAYPMTPSTGIMNYIASKALDYGIIVEQAEDEIAAINMALGASFAGVRAMTGTSGGGFALMTEGLSLAGMTETPVVIALAQRPGPATGLPTRTEQADLQFALYTAHGEFPRVVFAPGSPEQAFYLTNKAFDLAERFQIPAIILTDQYLADSQWTYESFDLNKLRYQNYRLRAESLENLKDYKRHAVTETGISPLGIPGESRHLIVTDSDEHDEEGHIIEDAVTRVKMVEKRLFKKLPLIKEEISGPYFYGDEGAEILLIGWGSSYGVLKEVVDILSQDLKVGMMHFSEIYPLPDVAKNNYLERLRSAKITICAENNATGQFARLIRAETGYSFDRLINKYDGRPFSTDWILENIKSFLF